MLVHPGGGCSRIVTTNPCLLQDGPFFAYHYQGKLVRMEVPPENISLYLSRVKDIKRYDNAFRKLYVFCTIHGSSPDSMSIEEAGNWLLKFTSYWPHEGRNA